MSKLGSVRNPTLGQIPPLWRVFFIILFISMIVRGRVCNFSGFTDVMKHCTGCYHFADLSPAPVAPLHTKCESVSLADQYLAQLWPVFFCELCELIKTNRIQSIFSIHSGRLFMGSTVAYDTATHLFFSEFEVHAY